MSRFNHVLSGLYAASRRSIKLHINFLELKAVFLALKEFQDLCLNNRGLGYSFSEAVAAQIEAPQTGSTRSVYKAKWTIFTTCHSNQVDFRVPPIKSIATSCCIRSKTESCCQVPLKAIGQPLQTNWETHPLMSAKMGNPLASWIGSTETDPRVRGQSPPGTFPLCEDKKDLCMGKN